MIGPAASPAGWPTLNSATLSHETVLLAPGASYGTGIVLGNVGIGAGATVETTGGLQSALMEVRAGSALGVQAGGAIVAQYSGTASPGLIMDIGDAAGNAMIANDGTIASEANTTVDLTVWGHGLVNNGHMIAEGGRLEIGEGHGVHNGVDLPPVTSIAGTGTIEIAHAGVLSFNATLWSGTIRFDDGTGTLWLWQQVAGQPIEAFRGGKLAGFQAGDKIDLFGVTANRFSYANNTLSVSENGVAVTRIALTGSYTAANFALSPDGFGGTAIRYVATAPAAAVQKAPTASALTPADLPGAALLATSAVQSAGAGVAGGLLPDAPPQTSLLLHMS